ncbi:MAG TPA: DUF3800 domain-containing protein [Candidatus Eremiobacteraceae bacterium]|nr:DUF3800 domain-containing protein [Candidatus Eremiobacteraceae bacterium]
MLNAYIDDSGDAKNKQVSAFTLSGYVFTAHNSMLFCEAWREVLRRYDLPYIHTREAIRLDGVFAKVPGDGMNACLVDCARVIRDHVAFELSCVVETDAWRQAQATIAKHALVEHGLVYYTNPYFLQYMSLVQMAHHFKLTRGYNDDIIFFFDEHNVNMREAADLYRATAKSAPEMLKRIGISDDPPRFVDDEKMPPLQAADMAAYAVRKQHDPNAGRLRPFEEILRGIEPKCKLLYDEEAFRSKLGVEVAIATAEREASDRTGATEVLSWLAGQRYREYVRERFGKA